MRNRIVLALAFYCFLSTTATAQTTVFTYQGKLTDGGTLASGQYDLQVKLFDALTEGTQQGATLTLSNVAVVNGIFTVQLDFGACDSCFNGAARYLEVAVKKTTDATFVTLTPRQPITASPYAMKTSNLTFNGAHNDGNIILTASNTFAGVGAGVNTTPSGQLNNFSGKLNSFYGAGAGQANTTGNLNSFFGTQAGLSNTIGTSDAFFGLRAGASNTTGSSNAFFGYLAGASNTSGHQNAFFGIQVGYFNTTGTNNTFFGSFADFSGTNTTGSNNTLLGYFSKVNAELTNATAIGARAQVTFSNSMVLGSIAGVNGATANTNIGIGTSAPAYKLHVIDSSNTGLRVQTNLAGGTLASFGGNGDFLIDAPGVGGGRFVVKESGNVGIGAPAPAARLQVVTGDDINPGVIAAWDGRHFVVGGTASTGGIGMSYSQTTGVGYIEALIPNVAWADLVLQSGGGRVGIGTSSPVDRLEVNGIIRVQTLGAAGSTALCRNGANQISSCSSSIRYKTNIAAWHSGLSLINRLRPVTFNWKANNEPDLGLVAEEVAKVEPLFTFTNEQGQVEGVKYDRLSVVLVNAAKELKAENEALQQTITQQGRQLQLQQQQIDALKRLVCKASPDADLCKQ